MRRPSAVVAILALLAGTGCMGVGGSDPGDVIVATLTAAPPPDPDAPPPDDVGGELVEPTPGMADVRAVPWDEATVDGATVTVSWWSGVAPCNVLDRVEVDEGDDVVTITLFEGSDPAEPDAACIEIAQRKSTEVELGEPVGQRSLADGADPASE